MRSLGNILIKNGRRCHAELSLGGHADTGNCLRSLAGEAAGIDGSGAGIGGGGSNAVYHHGRNYGIVGGIDGNCPEERRHKAGVPGYRSFYEFHVSEAAQGASGAGIYHHQCDCQYLWAWLGSDAGGTEGHGSAQRSRRGTAAYRKNRAEKWDGK